MDKLQKLRATELLRNLALRLKSVQLSKPIILMEVCGTHTMAIHRAGLPALLPQNLKLLSGPGCPVCVTPLSYLDTAMAMSNEYDIVLTTFGDMMRVPGSSGTLSDLRHEGRPIEIVYSPLGAVEIAVKNPEKNIVFLAVGFETTVPTVAAAIKYVRKNKIGNFSILSSHKLVIPALETLINDPDLNIDGFILPGHVSIVLGSEPYRFIVEKHHRACVITGFETADVIQGIMMLVEQIERHKFDVEIQYRRVVQPNGNSQARAFIEDVFKPADTTWRGFGTIPQSGLVLREEFADYDASRLFPVTVPDNPEPKGCSCGDILRGRLTPPECALFGRVCNPENPVGPCMVSTEGACAAYFQSLSKTVSFNKGNDLP